MGYGPLAHFNGPSSTLARKLFGYFGELQSDFCENLTKFYQISHKILVYLTDFSSQIMSCTVLSHQTIEDTHFMWHPDQNMKC